MEEYKTKFHRVLFDKDTGNYSIHLLSCDHEYIKVKRRYSNGTLHIYEQCKKCGDFRGGAKSQNGVNMATIPFAITPPHTWEDFKEERTKLIDRLKKAQKRIRDAYYKTPEWTKKRALVMERDGKVCQACQDEPATQVYHLNYRHFKNEPLFDLVAICDRCHTSISKMDKGENYTPIKHD